MAFENLEILFEDADLLVVNKPVGLVVDAGAERAQSADDEGVTDLIRVLAESGRRVFAFHRLDRDTSGLVLLGKSRKHAAALTQDFEAKRIRKSYLAVVHGEWPGALSKVEAAIGDRASLTTFRKLLVAPGRGSELGPASGAASGAASPSETSRSLIEALPKTGRKHQIRIHCAGAGFPIVGDALYGAVSAASSVESAAQGHALHAYSLGFHHPGLKKTVNLRAKPAGWRDTFLSGFDATSLDRVWSKLFPVAGP